MTYTAKAFGKTIKGDTFADMSRQYEAARNDHFRKGGRPKDATIIQDGKAVARISNNGRVWPLTEWFVGMVPLYDNRASS